MSLPSADDLAETIDVAREYLRVSGHSAEHSALCARDFASALVRVTASCVVGAACDRHGGEVHGQEAEELRAGVEQVLRNTADVPDLYDDDVRHVFRAMRKSLIFLLDRIDARDSLAFREATDDAAPDLGEDARRWRSVQRQLKSLHAALVHAYLPDVEAKKLDSTKLLAHLLFELTSTVETSERLLRLVLEEKGIPCE